MATALRRSSGITDPRLAARVYAIVGGTPAYHREFIQDDAPDGLDNFDAWVKRAVLNPGRPYHREPALYHSVLAAVAEGNNVRGSIANYIGRKATDLQHPLTVLEDAGLLAREPDLQRAGRSTYRITEPLVTFYVATMRPAWTALEQRRGADVWRRSQKRFTSGVLGPRFEELVRAWVVQFADPATFGDVVAEAGHGTVTDSANRITHQIDVLAVGEPPPDKVHAHCSQQAKRSGVCGSERGTSTGSNTYGSS